ncbi:MAG: hypothetical protein R3E84_07485 [Pseudomonadales bacterium]
MALLTRIPLSFGGKGSPQMFNPNSRMIDGFIAYMRLRFEEAFSNVADANMRLLDQSVRASLSALLECDCPYHDIQHTMLVTDIGQTMLQGRQLAHGDVTPSDWLHAVIAMLFHDVGYIRSLLAEDTPESCIADDAGNRVAPPKGCTDAFMTPYHVARSRMFVRERFRNEPLLDLDLLCGHIEMTRFPVPKKEEYQKLDSFGALVRSADLLGQMADPQYLKKLSRLFAEFIETGEAARQGFKTPGELRAKFSGFFNAQVRPYVGEGLRHLRRAPDGQQWIANLHHHLHVNESEMMQTGETAMANVQLLRKAAQ